MDIKETKNDGKIYNICLISSFCLYAISKTCLRTYANLSVETERYLRLNLNEKQSTCTYKEQMIVMGKETYY